MSFYTYVQTTGKLLDVDGALLGIGYSGHGEGLNNAAMEAVVGIGPIPAGMWSIDLDALPLTHHLGPYAFALTPVGHDAHGRSLFRIHGDGASMDHTSSHGCIILGPHIRQHIQTAGITSLKVIPA